MVKYDSSQLNSKENFNINKTEKLNMMLFMFFEGCEERKNVNVPEQLLKKKVTPAGSGIFTSLSTLNNLRAFAYAHTAS